MIYISLIFFVVLLIIISISCVKAMKKMAAIRRGEISEALFTLRDEKNRVWMLNSYLLITIQILLYCFVFGGGTATTIETNNILKCIVAAIILPPNSLFIISFGISSAQNNKIKNEKGEYLSPMNINKKSITITAILFFVFVAIATTGLKLNVLNPWRWFSVLVYAYIVAFGIIIKVAKVK